jgi:hypothetical protein
MNLPQRMPRPPPPADLVRRVDAPRGRVLPVKFRATTCATRLRDAPALAALRAPMPALPAESPVAA